MLGNRSRPMRRGPAQPSCRRLGVGTCRCAQARRGRDSQGRRAASSGRRVAATAPTPGSYNCRLIKVGKATPKSKPYESFKPFFCYVEVEGDLLTIVKQTGSQRPAVGFGKTTTPTGLIFLGSLALGSEDQPIAYGTIPKRDMAGVAQRIAPFKWRLVIPWPQSTSKLDVFELTPSQSSRSDDRPGLLADPRRCARFWSGRRRPGAGHVFRGPRHARPQFTRPRCGRCARCSCSSTMKPGARRAGACGTGRPPVGRAAGPGLVDRRGSEAWLHRPLGGPQGGRS
jgi:hypothetical protein